MMQTVTMSEEAFMTVLELLQCKEDLHLPRLSQGGSAAMEKFIKGREELCQKGLTELDFDGTIYQTKEFARMNYAIQKAQAVLFFQNENKKEWFFRGLIELLHITMKENEYVLTQCKVGSFMSWIREYVYTAEEGVLMTKAGNREKETMIQDSPVKTQERANVLASHMCVFFKKEEPDIE